MHIHYLQHVPFEGLGSMASYFNQAGHHLSASHLYRVHTLPEPSEFDWLIIMGGPMGVDDPECHAWMAQEKAFIEASIGAGKIVLGICLGAQLIADVLDAKVYPNPHREIGWHPVYDTGQANDTILKDVIPAGLEVFHWHGDTFDIPKGCVSLASSAACPIQGFILGDRVVGLQFHLETTPDSVKALLDHCGGDLDGSRFVQNEAQIMAKTDRCAPMNAVMVSLLDRLETNYANRCRAQGERRQ